MSARLHRHRLQLLALALAAAALGGCGSRGEQPVEVTPIVKSIAPGGPIADPEVENPQLRVQSDRDLQQRPAFQHLPVAEAHLTIDLVDVDDDGRLVLLVDGDGTLAEAQRRYRDWLRRYGDSGAAYQPTFAEQLR